MRLAALLILILAGPAAGQAVTRVRLLPHPMDPFQVDMAMRRVDASAAQRAAALEIVLEAKTALRALDEDVVDPWLASTHQVFARVIAGEMLDASDVGRIVAARRPIVRRQAEIERRVIDRLGAMLTERQSKALAVELDDWWRMRLPNGRSFRLGWFAQRALTPDDEAAVLEFVAEQSVRQRDTILDLDDLGTYESLIEATTMGEPDDRFELALDTMVAELARSIRALDRHVTVETAWQLRQEIRADFVSRLPWRTTDAVDEVVEAFGVGGMPEPVRHMLHEFLRTDNQRFDTLVDLWEIGVPYGDQAQLQRYESVADARDDAAEAFIEAVDALGVLNTWRDVIHERPPRDPALIPPMDHEGWIDPVDRKELEAWCGALHLELDFDALFAEYYAAWRRIVSPVAQPIYDDGVDDLIERRIDPDALDAWFDAVSECDEWLVARIESRTNAAAAGRRLRALMAWRHATMLGMGDDVFDWSPAWVFVTQTLILTGLSADEWWRVDHTLTAIEAEVIEAAAPMAARYRRELLEHHIFPSEARLLESSGRSTDDLDARRDAAQAVFESDITRACTHLAKVQSDARQVFDLLDQTTAALAHLEWLAQVHPGRVNRPRLDRIAREVIALDDLTPTERAAAVEARGTWLPETLRLVRARLETELADERVDPTVDRHAALEHLQRLDRIRRLRDAKNFLDGEMVVRLELISRDRVSIFGG